MGLLEKFQQIRTFIFDIDGVLTDGSILVLENGEMARTMHTKDGYALQLAIKKGYQVFIVSGAARSAVEGRLQKLGISEIHFQITDKKNFIEQLLNKYGLHASEALYMGDDIPDLPVFSMVGLGCCPADAAIDVLSRADFISTCKGGWGCVREVVEKVMKVNNHWNGDASIASN